MQQSLTTPYCLSRSPSVSHIYDIYSLNRNRHHPQKQTHIHTHTHTHTHRHTHTHSKANVLCVCVPVCVRIRAHRCVRVRRQLSDSYTHVLMHTCSGHANVSSLISKHLRVEPFYTTPVCNNTLCLALRKHIMTALGTPSHHVLPSSFFAPREEL